MKKSTRANTAVMNLSEATTANRFRFMRLVITTIGTTTCTTEKWKCLNKGGKYGKNHISRTQRETTNCIS